MKMTPRNRESEGGAELSFTVFLGVYLGTLALGAVTSIVLEAVWGFDIGRSLAGYTAILFVLGAARRPEILFQVLRCTGWFVLVQSDLVMQVVLGFVALLAASGAVGLWKI